MDEVRISSTNRSADWIKFEYRNVVEADNELTWATEEEAPETSSPSNLIGNPYMFTGRRYDLETGLYYYRARYYNPQIGRFLQTDPIGYGDGINWYNCCGSNPVIRTDPSGLSYSLRAWFDWEGSEGDGYVDWELAFFLVNDDGRHDMLWSGGSLEEWYTWIMNNEEDFGWSWIFQQPAYNLVGNDDSWDERLSFEVSALIYLDIIPESTIIELGEWGTMINLTTDETNNYECATTSTGYYAKGNNIINWDRNDYGLDTGPDYTSRPPLASLAHEVAHAAYVRTAILNGLKVNDEDNELNAFKMENRARQKLHERVPEYGWVLPRPYNSHEAWNLPPSWASIFWYEF